MLPHNIKSNISLKKYTTFKIGGPARYFVEVDDLPRLAHVLNWARKNQQKVFVLGGGSNLLFMDDGFDGLVVKLVNNDLTTSILEEKIEINCGAGLQLGRLVQESFKIQALGLEWAIGIPGKVGGAIRGNAGAFGGEMKNVVKNVQVINFKSREFRQQKEMKPFVAPNEIKKDIDPFCRNIIDNFSNEDCEFTYRGSIFKENPGLLIWAADFVLQKDTQQLAPKIAQDLLRKRREKQPSLTRFPSAGSVFKNPKVPLEIIIKFEHDTETKARDNKVPAGWLIAQCGLLGKRIGGAMISDFHGNFIVNVDNATAQDVLLLISLIKTKVRNKFNIHLQEEICIVY